ncbi:hypothetical protein WOLCODRAFT_155674 [Wolfiporia cocos MD-104 SS10]|uniref:DUF6699 domain-containing protein n=1 Tax=Wolfiporia cocos (strain MD-104) TaxID=742152 RepID=A0A2H3J5I6_WOLCO|nr:hypothetical protein WOLCODRAFT_155674 [Wolfiporia cocos MD-104 SS10]
MAPIMVPNISSTPSSPPPVRMDPIPLPEMSPKAANVHPLLSTGPSGSSPQLTWDMAHDYRTAVDGLVPAEILSEPATSPKSFSLSIQISQPTFPWRIMISSAEGSFVSVHDCLQFEATPAALRHEVNVAFHGRCAGLGDSAKEEKAKGVRRIDFLPHAHTFDGLEVLRNVQSVDGSAVLQLRVR